MTEPTKYQKKFKIKKGDRVVVLTGRARGSEGVLEKVDKKHDKVFIAGVNLYKKHVKPTAESPEGGIIDKSMPIHISNVALIDPKTNKPTKVGYKVTEEGKKVRFAKASGTILS